jgi:hypothetical protein
MEELFDRLRAALAETGLERAVLSHPDTLAHLCLFDPAVESGDLVLCDTSPWIDEHWSDTANADAVCARPPNARQCVFVVGAAGNEILTRFEPTL